MAWIGTITNAGAEVFTEWLEGATLTITSAEGGEGYTDSPKEATSLSDKKVDASIISLKKEDNCIRVKVQIYGTEEFLLKEIGLFSESTLIALYQNSDGVNIQEGEDYIYTFYANITVTNDGNIEVTIGTAAVVSQSTLTETVTKTIYQLTGASEYDTTTDYNVGDTVVYQGVLYTCVSTTSGEWDSSKWAEKTNGATNGNLCAFVGMIPNYYQRDKLFTPNKTYITVHANTQVNINNVGYVSTQDVDLPTDSVVKGGVDVYIYACAGDGTAPIFVLSQNSTVPDGYNENNSRKVGGFHCLCADVGIIENHPLSGYSTGDILPASVWDLRHRPYSEPEGMCFDEGTGKWYDIYLASWDGSKLVSAYGGTIADGASEKKWHGHLFKEELGLIGKRLMWRHEFQCVAKGSNEQTNISNSTDPTTTGGHSDTSSRRMISNIGLEDCCGAMWQWLNDEYEYTAWASSGVSSNSTDINHTYYQADNTGEQFFSSYGWENTKNTSLEHSACNYHSEVDDAEYGYTYGFPRQALAGGGWGDSSLCGSRSLLARVFGSRVNSSCGARGVSEPRVASKP